MSKWYLMSAYALTDKKRATIMEIPKHWDKATVYVVSSRSGKKMFAVSAGAFIGVGVGFNATMIKDTGRGYAHVAADDADLTVENIVTFDKDVVTGAAVITSKINNVGLDDKRAIYVFK